MYIIGINGWTTSGKTTTNDLLRRFDSRWQVHKFAAPLKEAVLAFTGEAEETDANKARLRPLYQAYGTYMRERHGADYWVNIGIIRALSSGSEFILFDDLRFPNEADALLGFGYPLALIRLDISEATRDRRYLKKYGKPLDPEIANHISEHAMDDYPHFTARIDAERPFREVFTEVLAVLHAQRIPFSGLDSHLSLLLAREAA